MGKVTSLGRNMYRKVGFVTEKFEFYTKGTKFLELTLSELVFFIENLYFDQISSKNYVIPSQIKIITVV